MDIKRYDVFISFSTEDQKSAEGVCGFLERNGIRCFVSYRDIPKGANWPSSIYNAVKQSKMMVAVFSENFNKSPHTGREITLASNFNIPILTFRIVPDEPTDEKGFFLANLNWIDAFPEPEKYFGSLLDNVNKIIGSGQPKGNEISADNVLIQNPSEEIISRSGEVQFNNIDDNKIQSIDLDNTSVFESGKTNQTSITKKIVKLINIYRNLVVAICIVIFIVLIIAFLRPSKSPSGHDLSTDTTFVSDVDSQSLDIQQDSTVVVSAQQTQVEDSDTLSILLESTKEEVLVKDTPKNVKDLVRQLILSPKDEPLDKTKLSQMRSLAEQGNPEAEYWMGNYYFSIKENKQYIKATPWWEKAAQQGHVKAMNKIAWCWYYGIYYSVDYGKAVNWYTKSAKKRDPEAMYWLGLCYYGGYYKGNTRNKQKFSEAKEWFIRSANLNFASAQCVLGKMYYRNEFGYSKPNYKRAFSYFLEASRNGSAEAQYHLGLCYKNGQGTLKDQKMSKYCINFAKKNGYDARK